jgi:hypothetical protein
MEKVPVTIPVGFVVFVNPGTRWIERWTDPKKLEVFKNLDGSLYAMETDSEDFPSREKWLS